MVVKSLPTAVQDFVEALIDKGFRPFLVGGAVRTFLLTKKYPEDLDFEVRSDRLEEAELFLDQLSKFLAPYHAQELSFHVWRLELEGQTLELAPARREFYPQDKIALGHKDFEIEICPTADDKQAFARRDFSVNAMAFEFLKNEDKLEHRFVDPYGGEADLLLQKKLYMVNRDFDKDPVRFLRAFRFSLKLGLKFDFTLEMTLANFDLSKLSLEAFFDEGIKKGGGLVFFQKVMSFIIEHQIKLPERFLRWQFLKDLKGEQTLSSSEEFLWALLFDQKLKIQNHDLLVLDLKLKKKDGERMASLAKLLNEIEVEKTLDELQAAAQISFAHFCEQSHLRSWMRLVDLVGQKDLSLPLKKFASPSQFARYELALAWKNQFLLSKQEIPLTVEERDRGLWAYYAFLSKKKPTE